MYTVRMINSTDIYFYHRHTNGNEFSRQGCLEPIEIMADGSVPQVEMTSCGPNGGPLDGRGEFPAYIACNVFSVENDDQQLVRHWPLHNRSLPKISQDGRDGDEETGFVTNISDNYGIGFKYFDCKGIRNTCALLCLQRQRMRYCWIVYFSVRRKMVERAAALRIVTAIVEIFI